MKSWGKLQSVFEGALVLDIWKDVFWQCSLKCNSTNCTYWLGLCRGHVKLLKTSNHRYKSPVTLCYTHTTKVKRPSVLKDKAQILILCKSQSLKQRFFWCLLSFTMKIQSPLCHCSAFVTIWIRFFEHPLSCSNPFNCQPWKKWLSFWPPYVLFRSILSAIP